jgi:DNA recombination protein RmuC
VAYGWRQTVLAENAATIRKLGEDLYKRLGTFNSHLIKLGRALNGSVDAFNSAVGSLERQVLPGARKFTELGVRAERDMDVVDMVDRLARDPQAREGEARENEVAEDTATLEILPPADLAPGNGPSKA